MNTRIETRLTIRLDDLTLNLSPEQARALYEELDALFGPQPEEEGAQPVYVPVPYPSAPAWPSIPQGTWAQPTWQPTPGVTMAGELKVWRGHSAC